MKPRGWVYVLSNQAMPGRVKIGFSMKDPVLRAEQLSGTGLPVPFVVEYDVLVTEPNEVEQTAHESLSDKHDAKEFFLVERQIAVEAIRAAIKKIGAQIIAEQYNFGPIDPVHIYIQCRKCGRRFSYDRDVAPQWIQCPSCGTSIC